MNRRALLLLLCLIPLVGCRGPRVLLRLDGNVDRALVTVNDRYIGRLEQLRTRGIALPPGEYRITVEQVGYFPWDRLIYVEDQPELEMDVQLTPIPD